jgi:hypothetical protein
MAGDWLAACKDLPDKPEVLLIANAAGMLRLEVAAFLVWKFWAWADAQSTDGTLPGVTLENLADLFTAPPAFWPAMQRAGWLEVTPAGLVIPNFGRWMGRSAKRRLLDTRRKQHARSLSACDADKSGTTEQNRREEHLGEESPKPPLARSRTGSASGPETAATAAPVGQSATPATASPPAPGTPGPAAEADPVVLTFPTVGRGAAVWHLRASKLAEYRDSFPAVDVLAECRRALQWVRDNPRNRKTRQGMTRYLGNWLGKSQNQARPPPGRDNGAARVLAEAKEQGL